MVSWVPNRLANLWIHGPLGLGYRAGARLTYHARHTPFSPTYMAERYHPPPSGPQDQPTPDDGRLQDEDENPDKLFHLHLDGLVTRFDTSYETRWRQNPFSGCTPDVLGPLILSKYVKILVWYSGAYISYISIHHYRILRVKY